MGNGKESTDNNTVKGQKVNTKAQRFVKFLQSYSNYTRFTITDEVRLEFEKSYIDLAMDFRDGPIYEFLKERKDLSNELKYGKRINLHFNEEGQLENPPEVTINEAPVVKDSPARQNIPNSSKELMKPLSKAAAEFAERLQEANEDYERLKKYNTSIEYRNMLLEEQLERLKSKEGK
jgi:hypothetical protein